MEPGFVFFLLAAAAVLASLGVAAIFLAPIAVRHLLGARGGGWGDLARVYATTKPPPPALPGQTLMVGFTQYRRCVAVAADETGLYLKLGFPLSFLRRPALLIPWTAFARVEKGRLYWREAAVLSVGDPLVATITAPMELFEKIRPRLASSLIGAGET